MRHEDERRIIWDFANGNYKSLKVVYVKNETPIGDHFHRNKDEIFFLATGEILELHLGDAVIKNVQPPYVINVPRGMYHKFVCAYGTVFFCGATELFDPNDEIRT